MIPAQRGSADTPQRLVLAEGHPHAGQSAVIVQPVGCCGYIVRIGDDPTRITPQYVPAEQLIQKGQP